MARQIAPGFRTPIHTSLPANPTDGQVINFLADAANGIVWQLRYRAASSSTYKWEFVGGSSLGAISASGANLTTANAWSSINGPQIVVPLAGDYDVSIGAYILNGGGAPALTQAAIGLKIGATNPGEPQASTQATNAYGFSIGTDALLSAVAAGTALLILGYMNGAGQTIGYNRIVLRVKPVRVG